MTGSSEVAPFVLCQLQHRTRQEKARSGMQQANQAVGLVGTPAHRRPKPLILGSVNPIASNSAKFPMTQAPKLTYPILFDFVAPSVAYVAKMQRFNELYMDTFKRLSMVRNQASAEAYMEGFSPMISMSGAQGPSGIVAGWPPFIQSALSREAKVQQHSLDIWASALRTTIELSTESAGKAAAGANGSGIPAAEGVTERRVSAKIIHFPDRRANAADAADSAVARYYKSVPVTRKVAVRHR